MLVENLFPSPLYTFEDLISEDINNEILEHLSVLKKIDDRNDNHNWSSDNTIFENPPYCMQVLRDEVTTAYHEVSKNWFDGIKNDSYESELKDSKKGPQKKEMWGWAVFQNQGDYIPPHVHPNATFSAIYFCQVPELKMPSGCVEFNNPVPGAAQGIPYKYMERKVVQPKERGLLIFPSYLSHWVHPIREVISKPRISVGIDIRITTDYLNRE